MNEPNSFIHSMLLNINANKGAHMKKIKASNARLRDSQHFGTDRSLLKKLIDRFGNNVTIGDLLYFRLSDFMNAGFTGKQTERIVKYLSFFGHKLPEYAYANKRSKHTNVDLNYEYYHYDKYEKFRDDPFYMDHYVDDIKEDLDKWEAKVLDLN